MGNKCKHVALGNSGNEARFYTIMGNKQNIQKKAKRRIRKCEKHGTRLEIDGLATFMEHKKIYFCRLCELEAWGFINARRDNRTHRTQ